MFDILHGVLHVVTFCIVMYLLRLSFVYKREAKKVTSAQRRYHNMQILLDLSEQGWVQSKHSSKGWTIEKASHKFCEILGYAWISEYDNEVIGMYKDDLVSSESHGKVNKTYNKARTVSIYLNKLRKKDGKEIWVETSGQTMIFPGTVEKRISVIKNIEHIINKFKE